MLQVKFLAGAAVGAFVATLVWLTSWYRREAPPKPVAPDQVIHEIATWRPIIVKEERLNQLSDMAIGKAIGGAIGESMVDLARRNLAVLDEMERSAGDPRA